MHSLLFLTLLGALALPAAPVSAAGPAPVTEAQVRAFMSEIAFASRSRDVSRLADALAPDCRIELRTVIKGEERVTLMTRDEYVDLLRSGYAAFKDVEDYDYEIDAQQITLERDPPAATVVSQVSESVRFQGLRRVTHSEETARVERRGEALKLVAVSALTTAD